MVDRANHVLLELGFTVQRTAGEIHGVADIVPEMWAPGTTSLRTSILATWCDTAAGHLCIDALQPRVPVTLELDVHAYQPPPSTGTVHAVARVLKAGRAVMVVAVDFTDQDGEPIAIGTASFMAAPDPGVSIDVDTVEMARLANEATAGRRLQVPLAERIGYERPEPGVVVLHRSDDGLNASNTVNGGLIAVAAEEAALSLSPGATLSSLALRYLRPVRVGPAVARATWRAGLGQVEVRDAGSGDRLAVVATTRTFNEGA
jgi:acyl-coenzyme A thioesterase PaaI-like protein